MGTQLTYGSLGQLSLTEWQGLVHSGEGLFQPVYGASPGLPGPHLSSTGRVSGDLLLEEIHYFEEYATPKQAEFLDSLLDTNLPAAEEYILRMTRSLPTWQRDFSALEIAVLYLQQERDLLLERQKDRAVTVAIKAPAELKEYCPEVFHDIDVQGRTRKQAREQIQKLLRTEIVPEEKYLRRYLREKKKELPFLFV